LFADIFRDSDPDIWIFKERLASFVANKEDTPHKIPKFFSFQKIQFYGI